ncbi:MAG: transglutaminase domain-containing protein, partial [Devosiaceae bacterium]|nr:transglutaminase domain-containing protein [Devosiaceae bacterium MH13]
GIVRGSRDDVPMGVFLRISHEGPAIALARTIDTLSPATEGVEALHTIMAILHESLPEDARLEPVDSPAAGEGQSQSQTSDVAEPDDEPALKRLASSLASAADTAEEPPADLAARAFCEAARLRGFPARLVSGYRLLGQDQAPVERRDVWAEAFVDQLGWIGFDCRTNSCPSSESVRAATGLDLPSISPLRFAHYGNGISPEQTTVIALTRVGG